MKNTGIISLRTLEAKAVLLHEVRQSPIYIKPKEVLPSSALNILDILK